MPEHEVLYRTNAHVEAQGRDKRVVFLVDGAEALMGLSGDLANFYGGIPDSYVPHATTLDYVAGAAGACLLGTFRRALSARGITVSDNSLTAEVIGEVEVHDDVPLLKRITVRYRLSAPPGADESAIARAHNVHHRACAVSRSLEAAIAITTELEILGSSR
jgi:uncharacterized OsmC-like protein